MADGADIPRALAVLAQRLWLAGYGWIALARDGKLLVRQPMDTAVAGPERLVFEGGPVLGAGLGQDQEARRPRAMPGVALNTRTTIPDLTEDEQARYDALVAEAKEAIKPQADKVRAEYIEGEVEKLVKTAEVAKERARLFVLARSRGDLGGDDVIEFQDDTTATVAQILDNPSTYHGKACADPIEGRDYGRSTAAVYCDQGTPIVHSFAHGGSKYRLYAGDPPEELDPDVVADLVRVRDAAVRLAAMPEAARAMRLKDEARELGIGIRVLNREIAAVLSRQKQEKKKEKAERREKNADSTELEEIAAAYPLPKMDRLFLKYDRTRSGSIRIHTITGMDDGEPVWEPISTPFGIVGRLRYADKADAYGLRVVVQGMDGQPRFLDFDRGELAILAGSDIRSGLLKAGLRVEDNGDQVLVQALKAADPVDEVVVVSRTGWHLIDNGQLVFVSPGGDIIGAASGTTMELTTNAKMAMPAKAGSLDAWKIAIAAAVGARDCPHWVIGTLAGFAGTVVALTGLDTCGINLSGLSSAGKSMAQRMAVSAWSSPKLGAGLFQSMRTTENALESLAQSSNGTALALDEMGHADGRSVGRMIYSISSGVGKSRASRDAKLRDRFSWATFSFFSGECSIEEKIRGDGGEFMAGMAVRITDIDVTGVNRAVPKATLDAIAAIHRNHGHAGPAFVQGLVDAGLRDDPEQLRAAVLATAAKLAGEGTDSARIRAATPLAILHVAGSLAQRFGLLPANTQIGGAIKWAWGKFVSSSDALSLDPAEQAIRSIRGWVAERWDVTIKHVDAALDSDDKAMRLNNREALGWYDANAVYIPVARVRDAAGKTIKEQQIGKILEQRGLLERRHDAQRAALRTVPRIGKIDCYALKRSEFGRSDSHSPDLHVVDGDAA